MRERALAVLRASVSVLGTLPFAVLAGVALASFSPVSGDVRMAIGFGATVPIWVAAMTLSLLDTRVWRAALALLASSAALALAIGAHA